MTKDEALKLALEALEMYGARHRSTYLIGGAWDKEITMGDQAITEIKAALAQPKLIELVRADEREAILDLVDGYAKNNTDLVEAIRARGNT